MSEMTRVEVPPQRVTIPNQHGLQTITIDAFTIDIRHQQFPEEHTPTQTSRRKTFSVFASSSSMHGLSRIADQKNMWHRRIFWVCLTIAMAGLLTQHVIQNILKYYSYPSTTQIYLEHLSTATFPAITLCNNNGILRSRLQRNQFALEILQTALFRPSAFKEINSTILQWANRTNFMEFYKDNMIPFSELITECKIGQQSVPCPTTAHLQTVGRYQLCHTFLNTNDTVFMVTQPGLADAFSFQIDIQQHEYTNLAFSPGAGVKVQCKLFSSYYLGALLGW